MRVEVLKSLGEDVVLWRYMTLDKFVSLIGEKSLFFASLEKYSDSDPFEGYLPKVILKQLYEQSRDFHNVISKDLDFMASHADPSIPEFPEIIAMAQEKLKKHAADFKERNHKVMKSSLVSCWFSGEHESEAMWKLYGDSGKGIAIRTTVGRLREALEGGGDLQDKKIFIGFVKYIDFDKQYYAPGEASSDGHITPLLKRKSFEHEREVRAYFVGDINKENYKEYVSLSANVLVDVERLVEQVYISPYVSPQYVRAVKMVVEKFNLQCDVRQSALISAATDVWDFLDDRSSVG